MSKRGALRGVALLEAIVALALLAGAGGALFAWMHHSLDQAARLEEQRNAARYRALAVAWLQTVDVSTRPSGQDRLAEGVTLRWRAMPVSDMLPVMASTGGQGAFFNVQRWQVLAEILADNGGVADGFQLAVVAATRTGLGLEDEP